MEHHDANFAGQTLAEGRYEVEQEIGRGSMGAVYRAVDTRLDTPVVLKVPTASRLVDDEFRRRFLLESRLLTKLIHPRIVRILDVGEHNGIPYYVMPFVGGGSLETRLISEDGELTRMTVSSLPSWLKSMAEALDFVHSKGYLHRDVKPANILFDEHGHPYLSDFGLSKVIMEADAHDSSGMTGANVVVGTPNYVAPELVLGEEYDGRCDQYSLATTVYEVLTGAAPLRGPTPSATMVNQTAKRPKPLHEVASDVPEAISQAVGRALSKQPAMRFESCVAFADAVLESVSTGSSTKASRPRWVVVKTVKVRNGQAKCPSCGERLMLSSKHAGKRGSCRYCDSKLLISKDVTELKLIELRDASSGDSTVADGLGEEVVLGLHVSRRLGLIISAVAVVIIVVGSIFAAFEFASMDVPETNPPLIRRE